MKRPYTIRHAIRSDLDTLVAFTLQEARERGPGAGTPMCLRAIAAPAAPC